MTSENIEREVHRISTYVVMVIDIQILTSDLILSEREQQLVELETLSTTANNNLQKTDTTLANLKTQAKTKKDELKGALYTWSSRLRTSCSTIAGLERRLKNEIEQETLDIAIKEATVELGHRKTYARMPLMFSSDPHVHAPGRVEAC